MQGSDQIVNILADSAAEETTIKLDETLASAGVYTHLNDSVPNPNSGTGTYFKHQAEFIAYDQQTKDINNKVTKENTVDLQSVIQNFPPNSYVTLTKPTLASDPNLSKTVTLQQLFQAMIDSSTFGALVYDNLPVA